MTVSTQNYSPKPLPHDKGNALIPNLLETRDIAVDVMPDGSACVGIAGTLAERALLQFTFPAIFVNCGKDFAPQAGTVAATIYLDEGRRTFHGGSFREKLTDFTDIDFAFDDLDDDGYGFRSEYRARIRLHLRKARQFVTVSCIKTYLLGNIVKLELQQKGFVKQLAHYVKD